MGESAVLAHSYSFAAPITRNDSHEDNTVHALSQSVSFGKFMTENLEWGKWSSFSHKKYVEEAEKYSRPGSVAQKKAFFEAHYKRIAEAKKAATEEQPSVTPAEVLLQALETQPPLNLQLIEEESGRKSSFCNVDDVLGLDKKPVLADEDEETDKTEEKEAGNGLVGEFDDKEKKQEEEVLKRRSITKNKPVFRLSLEKTIPPPKPIETAVEKRSERPITTRNEERPVHRQRFSLLKCFTGNGKSQDQNQRRRNVEKKKQKKQYLCLCLKPKTVRDS